MQWCMKEREGALRGGASGETYEREKQRAAMEAAKSEREVRGRGERGKETGMKKK